MQEASKLACEQEGPDQGTGHVEGQKARVVHGSHAGHKGRKGAYDGHEARQHDGLAPVLGVELQTRLGCVTAVWWVLSTVAYNMLPEHCSCQITAAK